MKKRVFLLLFALCGAFALSAQTIADSLAIVTADWKTRTIQKEILCREVEIPSLYGVPQHITILEITPRRYRLDILIHNPMEKTSESARESGAVAAINGSFFNMKKGNSVCFLYKDGAVRDTTGNGALGSVCNGAVKIQKGKLSIVPWNKTDEKGQWGKSTLLVSGPLMLLDGKRRDLSACNKGFVMTKHPRSAVAVTKDGKLLLITVDGRFKGKAEGINIPELAHLISVLGGEDALNLDGGGSSTLWSSSAPDNGVLNKLCDNNLYDNKGERKVANSLCVYDK